MSTKSEAGAVTEEQLIEQTLSDAQERLIEKYSIPKVNKALESIADQIPELKKAIVAGIEKTNELELNKFILKSYDDFDLSKRGYLQQKEFLAFLAYFFNSQQISLEAKTIQMIAKAIDKNGDKKYHKDQIFRTFNREERKEWIVCKRKEAEAKWIAKKQTVQEQKQQEIH